MEHLHTKILNEIIQIHASTTNVRSMKCFKSKLLLFSILFLPFIDMFTTASCCLINPQHNSLICYDIFVYLFQIVTYWYYGTLYLIIYNYMLILNQNFDCIFTKYSKLYGQLHHSSKEIDQIFYSCTPFWITRYFINTLVNLFIYYDWITSNKTLTNQLIIIAFAVTTVFYILSNLFVTVAIPNKIMNQVTVVLNPYIMHLF